MGGYKRRLKEIIIKRPNILNILRKRKLKRSFGECFYCGIVLNFHSKTIDHKTPISLGGSNKKFNKVSACKPCNVKKGSTPFDEWMDELNANA